MCCMGGSACWGPVWLLSPAINSSSFLSSTSVVGSALLLRCRKIELRAPDENGRKLLRMLQVE